MRDPNEDLQFVKLPEGYQDNNENARQSTANRSIEHIQLNFYGIKTDSPSTKINVSTISASKSCTNDFIRAYMSTLSQTSIILFVYRHYRLNKVKVIERKQNFSHWS